MESIQFEWDKFLPTLEKDFPDILKVVLSHDNHQQLPNSNENICTPNESKNQYNAGIDNRTRTLTMLSPSMHHNVENRFQHMLHSMPKKLIHMVETVISQIAHTKEFKKKTHISPHQSDCQAQHVNNKAFTIEGDPGQVTCFIALI